MPRISYFLLAAMVFSILQTLAAIAFMGLTFTTANWNIPRWLTKTASVCRCIRITYAQNESSVEDTMVKREKETEDGSASHAGNIENLSSGKLAFVVSLCIVVAIVVALLFALNR